MINSEGINVPEWLPDGNGGFTPCPFVLTETEAIRWLRLDTIKVENPEATLRRYRKAGLLRGVQVSKAIFYERPELKKFVARLREENPR